MQLVIKKFFMNTEGSKQFRDIVTGVLDPEVLDPLSKALCEVHNTPVDLGIYAMDMDTQTILHKWSWDATLDPPAAVRAW